MKRFLVFLIAGASSFVLTACSQDLSRNDAKEKIAKATATVGADYHLLQDYVESPMAGPADWNGNNNAATCQALATQGYITLSITQYYMFGNAHKRVHVDLTAEGQKIFTAAPVQGPQGVLPGWWTPICRMEILDVTGISKLGETAAAAQFNWHWKLSPISRTAWASTPEVSGYGMGSIAQNPDSVSSSTMTFQRFDDGWRVAN